MVYAQINEQGYCIGISQLLEAVDQQDVIPLDTYDLSYMGRKYDNGWTEEYFVPPIAELPEPDPSALTLDTLALAIADVDAQREADKLENQLAIAELAETLLTGGANNG